MVFISISYWQKGLTALIGFALLSIVFVFSARAQENPAHLKHYTVGDGLATQTTYNLIQDRNGFVWIGTQAGVSRFDGKEFVNYTTDDGLGDNEIIALYEDKKGRIWCVPFGRKLSYYWQGRFYTESNDALLKKLPEKCRFAFAVEDHWGNLYIQAHRSQVVFMIDTADRVTTFDLSPWIGEEDVVTILLSDETEENVYCVTFEQKVFALSGKEPREIALTKDHPLTDSLAWFSNPISPRTTTFMNSTGIYTFRNLDPVLLLAKHRLPDLKSQFYVQLDHDQNLWITNMGRTLFFRRLGAESYAEPMEVLSGKHAITCFDREGHIWFCTGSKGIYRTSYEKLFDSASFSLNRSLLQKNVTCVYADADDNLWIGYANGYVTRLSPQGEASHYDINQGNRFFNRVLQIMADADGDIWCATDETCIMLAQTASGHYQMKTLTDGRDGSNFLMAMKGFFTDSNGVLHATQAMGNIVIDKEHLSTRVVQRTRHLLGRTYSSLIDRKGRWYTSTESGLQRYEKGTVTHLGREDSLLNIRMSGIVQNHDGILFLVTYSSGIIALKDDQIIAHLTREKGLAGIICRHVHLREDTLYIATNGGVSVAVFDQDTFRVLENFGTLEGLPSNDVNDLCFIGNTMYVATSEGMAALQLPLHRKEQASPPVLSLRHFKVNGKSLDLTSPMVFPYDNQQILISYIAPTMDRPTAVEYRYRLSNENTWQSTSSTQLEFNDLPYGSYEMEIQAKKYNSGWSTPASLLFSITPPVYATWWFRSLALLLVVAALFVLIRYILHRRLQLQLKEMKQKEVIEKERNRIAADIHDEIGAELTNMVILTRILKSGGKPGETAASVANKLEQSADGVITKMNEVIWTLKASGDNLHNLCAYLRSFSSSFMNEHGLNGSVHISDELYCDHPVSAEASRNLFLILKESLHNTVKHAQASAVVVEVTLTPAAALRLVIRDNGMGFDSALVPSGNGLANIRKRASMVKGSVIIRSTPGEGTEVSVIAPLKGIFHGKKHSYSPY